jgi:hypothetical protein
MQWPIVCVNDVQLSLLYMAHIYIVSTRTEKKRHAKSKRNAKRQHVLSKRNQMSSDSFMPLWEQRKGDKLALYWQTVHVIGRLSGVLIKLRKETSDFVTSV